MVICLLKVDFPLGSRPKVSTYLPPSITCCQGRFHTSLTFVGIGTILRLIPYSLMSR